MKLTITLVLVFVFFNEMCSTKEQILIDLVNDDKLKVFFENRRIINLAASSDCKLSSEFKKMFNIKLVSDEKVNALKFNSINIQENCLEVEIQLFSENTIYKAEYGIFEYDSLVLNNSYLIQIRQPK
ncbi:hypothetical protein LB452_00380 [Psychroflexus sp. CAK8W]|uniref:Uncharacterized protein n=1 Tax=Psychroflexus longus TaxID=2873596 RepID=A0ABS7XG24_9FLAO|nr:hypothetical protein [Psychroflexus longus]MBZ9777364.1 hypothetical protein [Psychroflexus longus]